MVALAANRQAKTSLVYINDSCTHWLATCEGIIARFPEHKTKFITFSAPVRAWLLTKGVKADLVAPIAYDGEVAQKPRAFNFKQAREYRLQFEKMVSQETLGSFTIPGTELEIWKVLALDRFDQWLVFDQSRRMNALLDSLKFDLLIAPMDIHDRYSQRLMRIAHHRKVESYGIQRGELRTRENLYADRLFTFFCVETLSAKQFLTDKCDIPTDRIEINFNATLHKSLARLRHLGPNHNSVIRRKFNLSTSQEIVLVLFSIRHIWETRLLLRQLIELQEEDSILPFQLTIRPDGEREESEYKTLFHEELEALQPTLLTSATPIIQAVLVADKVVSFYPGPVIQMAAALNKPSILFDPYDFNASQELLGGEGAKVHSKPELCAAELWNVS